MNVNVFLFFLLLAVRGAGGVPFLFEWVCSVCSEALLYSIAFVFLAALAVYTRSAAAYEGLKSFKPLQIPSVRTLKH